jgi:hypothetical protein
LISCRNDAGEESSIGNAAGCSGNSSIPHAKLPGFIPSFSSESMNEKTRQRQVFWLVSFFGAFPPLYQGSGILPKNRSVNESKWQRILSFYTQPFKLRNLKLSLTASKNLQQRGLLRNYTGFPFKINNSVGGGHCPGNDKIPVMISDRQNIDHLCAAKVIIFARCMADVKFHRIVQDENSIIFCLFE